MAEFIKRNIPVFVIGLVTVAVFITIIFTASKNPTKRPDLQEIKDEQLITGTTPTIGPKDSKVVLVEFSDFECPACKAFQPVISSLIVKYQEHVLFGYKHFPLPQHKNSRPAAIAAEAAHEQDKFWKYADKLFEIQPDFTKENFIKLAGELQLDVEKFTADLDNGILAERVSKDYEQANRIGLSSTPSFALNNKLLEVTSFADIENAIVAELAKNNITIDEPVQEPTPSTPPSNIGSEIPRNNMDAQYGIVDIRYDDNGFYPSNTKALVGQIVRITNDTGLAIRFQQIIAMFTNVSNPLTLAPGESVEFRLVEEGLWTFKESDKRHYGSVFSVAQ